MSQVWVEFGSGLSRVRVGFGSGFDSVSALRIIFGRSILNFRTSLSFYILILILFEVASRVKLNLYKNTISSDVLRSTAEQIEMIDLSNQTHLPRTNPTQIISLHSVHELFMKYLYFQTRKTFFESKAYFSNLKEFILLVSSVTFCLFPAGFFHYPDFGFSPDFSTVLKYIGQSH